MRNKGERTPLTLNCAYRAVRKTPAARPTILCHGNSCKQMNAISLVRVPTYSFIDVIAVSLVGESQPWNLVKYRKHLSQFYLNFNELRSAKVWLT